MSIDTKKEPEAGRVFVYVISDLHGCVKVGKAIDVESRRYSLQTGNPRRLVLWGTIACDSEEQAFETEKRLHTALLPFKGDALGEWFQVSPHLIHALDDLGVEWNAWCKEDEAQNKLPPPPKVVDARTTFEERPQVLKKAEVTAVEDGRKTTIPTPQVSAKFNFFPPR